MDVAPQPRPAVLVIEDDPDLRGAMTDALDDAGYHVATAVDGASALALLRGVAADVILVDLHMPGMNGREFIARWHAESSSRAPVVLMSGSEKLSEPPAGCARVMAKPFTLEELVAVVRQLVGR